MLFEAKSLKNAQVTVTANATEVDLGGLYVSPGGGQVLCTQSIQNAGAATDAGGVTGSIQASATTVDSDFAAIATFTAYTDTEVPAFEQTVANIPASARYLRHRAVVTGVPKLNVSCTAFLKKRVS